MRFTHIRKRKLIVAERPNPYVSRWGTSYSIRRAGGITEELPRLPGIWTDATYINKGAPDSYTWTAPGIECGNVAGDIRKGGKRERLSALYAFAD